MEERSCEKGEGMRYTLLIDPDREEEVVVYVHQKNKLAERIEELVTNEPSELIGYTDDEIVKLDIDEISAFLVEKGAVWAISQHGRRYRLKLRLYQLEELFSSQFIKINQSCLVNVEKIRAFDTTLGASLRVTVEGGYRDYVSRRQVKAVKERIGF